MFRARAILTLTALSLVAMPVAAEEILHFKSGTALPVVSHTVKGDMVHVDLGNDSFMAFPVANIVRVETAGQHISLQGTNRAPSVMRVVSNPGGGAAAANAADQANSKQRRQEEENPDPAVDVDDKGVAVYRPMATSQQAAKRDTGFAGNRRARTGGAPGGVRGTRKVGNRMVIGTGGPRGRSTGGAGSSGSAEFEYKPKSTPVRKQPDSGSSSSNQPD